MGNFTTGSTHASGAGWKILLPQPALYSNTVLLQLVQREGLDPEGQAETAAASTSISSKSGNSCSSGYCPPPQTIDARRSASASGDPLPKLMLVLPPLASQTPPFQQKAQEANLPRLTNLATSPVRRSRQFPGRTQVADDSESSNFPPTPKHSSSHQLPQSPRKPVSNRKSLGISSVPFDQPLESKNR